MDINKATYRERVIELITKENRPMQAKEICSKLQANGSYTYYPTLRVILSMLVTQKILCMAKYKFTPAFYCKPEWLERGKVRKEFNFNPYWNKKEKHELKNQSV